MFSVPGLIFGGTEGVGPHFPVLRSRTRFRRYRRCRVPFSYFTRSDSVSVVPRASAPVFMFCALRIFFGGIEGIVSRFHILRARSFFGTEDVGSRFHVLRARTRFLRFRGRSVPFSCFPCPDSFSAEPRASCPIFMFCAPERIFSSTEGVGYGFHVLRARNHFRRFQGRRLPFSCFARPESFSAVSRESCPIFMLCAPGLIFGGTEGGVSRFHVLRDRTRFRRYRGSRVPLS
jgi:hypothetical protein